jgi:hypothetical protein
MSFLVEKYVFRPGICEVVQADDTNATVTGPCYSCGQPQTVTVSIEALARFRDGGFAQDVFPKLPAEQREFLISGICGTCWDEMFPDAEEESEEE